MNINNIKQARKEIGNRLSKKIYEEGLNYAKLSNKIGISQSYISRICGGYYTPTIKTLHTLTRPLRVDIKDLLKDLEYWITPTGFSFSKKTFSKEEKKRYYERLSKEIELIELGDKKYSKEELKASISKGMKKKVPPDEFTVFDNSMEILHFNIGTKVYYIQKKIDLEEINYNTIYVIKFKESRRNILRKIYVEDNVVITIPYSKNPIFKPETIKPKDLKGIYETFAASKTL